MAAGTKYNRSSRQFCALVALFLTVAVGGVSGQVKTKDLAAYLAGVTERGRALYAYDQAAWRGTDAIFALHPDTYGLAHYICTDSPAGWTVDFLRWDAGHEHLLIAYEAKQVGNAGKFEARKVEPPLDANAAMLAEERALEVAIADFTAENRNYNDAILPAPDGNFYIYIYPGQDKDNIWPIGGDVRFTVSADGKQIVSKRQLHKTILDMQFDPALHVLAGYHSHILSDVPEDTDVLYVLTRKPSIPEYIVAGKRRFVVNRDGSIRLLK